MKMKKVVKKVAGVTFDIFDRHCSTQERKLENILRKNNLPEEKRLIAQKKLMTAKQLNSQLKKMKANNFESEKSFFRKMGIDFDQE